MNVDVRRRYCYAAMNIQTFEIIHIRQPRQVHLDAWLVLTTVLELLRSTLLVMLLVVSGMYGRWRRRGTAYGKKWVTRSVIKLQFFILKYRLWRFWKRPLYF